jgi:excisionase family DNA binding protein
MVQTLPPELASLPEILKADEVAALLRCSLRSVQRAFNSGKLPGVRLGDKLLRFNKADIIKMLEGA